MPLSPPKVVAPITACSNHVRLQAQLTGASIRIFASPNGLWEEVFSGQAKGPDETFKLNRRLKAGEQVRATQSTLGGPPFSPIETVEPEPDPSEIGPIAPDSHLHACASCAAFGNGLPGAEVVVRSDLRGELGRGIVDSITGAARVSFVKSLENNEVLKAQQRRSAQHSSKSAEEKQAKAIIDTGARALTSTIEKLSGQRGASAFDRLVMSD